MQPILNQYYQTLTEFDSKKHYLRIDKNNQELILCKKTDLKWTQRFHRWFWKPENERISYVAKKVFARMNNDMFEQLNLEQFNLESQNLTRFFQHLEYLSEKAEKQQGTRTLKERTFTLHSACFKRIGMLEKALQPESILELQRSIAQLTERKRLVESELGKLQQTFSEKESTLKIKESEQNIQIESTTIALKELTAKKIALEAEIVDEIAKQTDARQKRQKEVDEKNRVCQETAEKVAVLEFQRSYLQSDTVLWTEDGYLLCHSSIFSPDSMLRTEQMNKMVKHSAQVEQKLTELEAIDKEKSDVLRSLPKQVYAENIKLTNLKKFIAILELGPNEILDYAIKDRDVIQTIADFFLQPIPDLETPYVKDLERKISSQNKKIKEHQDTISTQNASVGSLKAQLKKTEAKLSTVYRKIQNLKLSLTPTIMQNDTLSQEFRDQLSRLLYY